MVAVKLKSGQSNWGAITAGWSSEQKRRYYESKNLVWSSQVRAVKKAYADWEAQKSSIIKKLMSQKISLANYGKSMPTRMKVTPAQLRGQVTKLGRKKISLGTGRQRQLTSNKVGLKLRKARDLEIARGQAAVKQLDSEMKRIAGIRNPYTASVNKYKRMGYR